MPRLGRGGLRGEGEIDHRDEREEHRGYEQHAGDPERDDEQAADERPGERADVQRERVEPERAHEPLLADDARLDRLTRRDPERRRRGDERGEHEQPGKADAIGDDKGDEDEADRREGGLREDEQHAAISTIRDHAAEQAKRQARDRSREADEPEIEGSALGHAIADGELHREPAEPIPLDAIAHAVREEAPPKDTEVAHAERREWGGARGDGRRGRGHAYPFGGHGTAVAVSRSFAYRRQRSWRSSGLMRPQVRQ